MAVSLIAIEQHLQGLPVTQIGFIRVIPEACQNTFRSVDQHIAALFPPPFPGMGTGRAWHLAWHKAQFPADPCYVGKFGSASFSGLDRRQLRQPDRAVIESEPAHAAIFSLKACTTDWV